MARQGPYSGTFAVYHTFHTAEGSAANGTAISCAGLAGVGVQLEGISGETITFEGSIDGSTWHGVQAVNKNDGSVGTTATADGLYFADVAGTDQFRARISTGGSGSVTATGYGVTITGGLVADIDIAGAEAATIADGADVAQGTTTDAAASSTVAETATARTGIGLWKGIKNILILLNAKFVSGTDIGDVTVNNAADAGVYTRPGTSATFPASVASGQIASGAVASGAMVAGSQVDGHSATLGVTTDAAAASDSAETTTARTQTALLKGLKNILVLLNAKFVTGTDIGDVDVLSIAAGEAHLGEVGYSAITISQQPTVTAGAYIAADAVGGLLTFADAARTSGGTGRIDSVVIIDEAKQNVAFDLVLFDRTFTATTDNAAFDPSDADLANCIGSIPIETTDYASFTDNSVATVSDKPLGFTLNATSMFGQLKTRGAPTYAATDDLTVKIHITRD